MNHAKEANEKTLARASTACRVCKRILRHPRSIAIGMGKTCGRKFPGTYERLANEADGQQTFVSDDGSMIDQESGGSK